MSGWVAIPHAATAAVRGALGRGAVLDLYARAHQLGYAPLTFTDRELSGDWEVNRHEVWRILEALEAAGCVTLERAEPGTKRASRVTVHPAASGGSGQSQGQSRSQNERPSTPATSNSRPEPRPETGPSRASDRPRALRPDQTRPDPDPAVSAVDRARAKATAPQDPRLTTASPRGRSPPTRDSPRFSVACMLDPPTPSAPGEPP